MLPVLARRGIDVGSASGKMRIKFERLLKLFNSRRPFANLGVSNPEKVVSRREVNLPA
jgi:hypothetical protein